MDDETYVKQRKERVRWLVDGLKNGFIGREAIQRVALKNVEDLMKIPYSDELRAGFDERPKDSELTQYYRALERISWLEDYLSGDLDKDVRGALVDKLAEIASQHGVIEISREGTPLKRKRRALLQMNDEEIVSLVERTGGWQGLYRRDTSLYNHIMKTRRHLIFRFQSLGNVVTEGAVAKVEHDQEDAIIDLALKAETYESYESFVQSHPDNAENVLKKAWDLAHSSEDSLSVRAVDEDQEKVLEDQRDNNGTPSIEESLERVLGISIPSFQAPEPVQVKKVTLEDYIRSRIPEEVIKKVRAVVGDKVFAVLAFCVEGMKMRKSSSSYTPKYEYIVKNLNNFIKREDISDYRNGDEIIDSAQCDSITFNRGNHKFEVDGEIKKILREYVE
ncbi:MAG: hypothetical protein ACTSVF_05860 [Candidatus Asgardarchaeia archaeon]